MPHHYTEMLGIKQTVRMAHADALCTIQIWYKRVGWRPERLTNWAGLLSGLGMLIHNEGLLALNDRIL